MVVFIARGCAKKNGCQSKVWITGCYRESAIYHLCIIFKKGDENAPLDIFYTLADRVCLDG